MRSEVTPLGADTTKIRIAVQNLGWLPTNVTKLAAEKKMVRGVTAEISCEGSQCGGAGSHTPEWLVTGKLRQESAQLVGISHIGAADGMFGGIDGTDDVAVFEWVVKGSGPFLIEAKHERAGTVRTIVDPAKP